MSLKKTIERELNIPAKVKIGGPGSLDVWWMASASSPKKEQGRMPQPAEIIGLLKSRV